MGQLKRNATRKKEGVGVNKSNDERRGGEKYEWTVVWVAPSHVASLSESR